MKVKLFELLNQVHGMLLTLSITDRIEVLNRAVAILHQCSPFKVEPVDCVQWIPLESIVANDYNPNKVAPPEMKLLKISITQTGFTQPLVVCRDAEGHLILIDGFHRFSLLSRNRELNQRFCGHAPVVVVNPQGLACDKPRRIATTIRHNRARGQHQIQAMSSIVQELSRLGWNDAKISEELGMDADEVLRLKQISGLMEMFQDRKYSTAWTVK